MRRAGLRQGALRAVSHGLAALRRRPPADCAGATNDRVRLEILLRASESMSLAETAEDAAGAAARAALRLTDGRAAFVLTDDGPLEAAGAGSLALFDSLREPLAELAARAHTEQGPILKGPAQWGGGEAALSVALLPLPRETRPPGTLCVLREGGRAALDAQELESLSALAGVASVALRNAHLRHVQRNFFTHVTDILVTALDAYLPYHSGHGRRVARYANLIGHRLELEEAGLERLHFAALLHDIGMLRIESPARHDSRSCRGHAQLGEAMLRPILLWSDVARIVRHHHEWYDGGGYPDRLAGEDIPFESRVIAVCDAFDAMTCDSSYRAPRELGEAVEEIERGSATQFDPVVVRAFLDLVEKAELDVIRGAEPAAGSGRP